MLWIGRADAGETWYASSTSLAREALDRLLVKSLPPATSADDAEFFLTESWAATAQATGKFGRLTISIVLDADLATAIDWLPPTPPPDAFAGDDSRRPLSLAKITVQSRLGRTVAAILVVLDAMYSLDELRRALEASFETSEQRPGRYFVLASPRQPIPQSRALKFADLVSCAVFRCENRSCRSRGSEVLAPVSRGLQNHVRPETLALACPSCTGLWQDRWALSFVRFPSAGDLLNKSVIEYRPRMYRRRISPFAGPMRSTVAIPSAPLRIGWSSQSIPALRPRVAKFLRTKHPADLREALVADPENAGAWVPALLDAENFKVLVDSIRALPPQQQHADLATALASAFCPRRTNNYKTEIDDYQTLHYHYIAYGPANFIRTLKAAGCLAATGKFLDVGCGIGEKVFLAHAFGKFERCDGIEYEARTAAVAEFLFDRIRPREGYPVRIMQGDALQFDHYGEYDVVYMYRPMRDAALMRRLIERIAAQAKPGAIFLDVLRENCIFKKVGPAQFLAARKLGNGEEIVLDQPADFALIFERMGIVE